jgi:hypothetical protein
MDLAAYDLYASCAAVLDRRLVPLSRLERSRTYAVPSPSYSAGLEFELTGVAQSVELA